MDSMEEETLLDLGCVARRPRDFEQSDSSSSPLEGGWHLELNQMQALFE